MGNGRLSNMNHPKLNDLRAGLLTIVNTLVAPKAKKLARRLRVEIERAPIESFRPQLWRLDLSQISSARVRTDRSAAGWDEQYIPNLQEAEFESIVDQEVGRQLSVTQAVVSQIFPERG